MVLKAPLGKENYPAILVLFLMVWFRRLGIQE